MFFSPGVAKFGECDSGMLTRYLTFLQRDSLPVTEADKEERQRQRNFMNPEGIS